MKYQLLGKSGLRVSELCLGTMTFGTEWGYGADKPTSQKIFDTFINAGGNFFDTANRYTEGTSEKYLGEFIQAERENLVVATKFSLMTKKSGNINDGGNNRKNLVQSLEQSLKRLNTPYVDLFYLHAWDFTTPEEEILRALDDLIKQGKILYIAISDTPAWVVSRANAIAELRAWTQFIGLQLEYSLIQRTPERDMLPMAKQLGITSLAWGALGGGALTGKYLKNNDQPKRLSSTSKRLDDRNTLIAQAVSSTADTLGIPAAQVALNWVRAQGDIIPLVGARNDVQLQESLNCVNVTIPQEQLQALTELSKIDLGFPHEFLQSEGVRELLFNGQYHKMKL